MGWPVRSQQFVGSDPTDPDSPSFDGVWLWPEKEEFFDVNEIEPGGTYWKREITYGPWKKMTR